MVWSTEFRHSCKLVKIVAYLDIVMSQPSLVTSGDNCIFVPLDTSARSNAANKISVDSSICSTSLSGGNQVDGLPPASSIRSKISCLNASDFFDLLKIIYK